MNRDVELAIRMTADASDASSALDDVGDSARAMASDVKKAAADADQAASKLDSVAASADNLDSKSAAATGALGALSSGFELVGLEAYAGGLQSVALATDFASGVGQALNLVLGLESVQRAKAVVQSAAHAAATIASTAATKTAAAGQWLLNAALSANPLGVVIALIAGLVAGFVLAYKNSETFRNIVQTAMNAARTAVQLVVDKVGDLVSIVKDKALAIWPTLSGAIDTAKGLIVGYFNVMTTPIQKVIDLVQNLIGFIKDIDFPSIPDGLNPFNRTAARGDLGTFTKGDTTASTGGGITLINLSVNGALDGPATARQIVQLLRRNGVRLGTAVGA